MRWFAAQDDLSDAQVKSGLGYVIKDGVASQAMGILTGGAFLIAFAIELGASNLVIGLIAAVGPLTQLVQLPAIFLVERVRHRRAIVVVAASLNRLCWLLIATIPFLLGPRAGLLVLLVSMAMGSAFGAVSRRVDGRFERVGTIDDIVTLTASRWQEETGGDIVPVVLATDIQGNVYYTTHSPAGGWQAWRSFYH